MTDLPVGARVRKINSRPGDAHQDGDTGTVFQVLVSRNFLLRQVVSGYMVGWDDLPFTPVYVSHKCVEPIPYRKK